MINLWEVSAEEILTQKLTALIPFLPPMQGGQDEILLQRAQATLQLDEGLRTIGKTGDFEVALSLFAGAVLGLDNAKRIFRWTMLDIIVESPLYQEIISQGLQQGIQRGLERGLEQGLEQGRAEEIRKVLLKFSQKRFGQIDEATAESINELSLEKAAALTEKFLDLENLADLQNWLAQSQN